MDCAKFSIGFSPWNMTFQVKWGLEFMLLVCKLLVDLNQFLWASSLILLCLCLSSHFSDLVQGLQRLSHRVILTHSLPHQKPSSTRRPPGIKFMFKYKATTFPTFYAPCSSLSCDTLCLYFYGHLRVFRTISKVSL